MTTIRLGWLPRDSASVRRCARANDPMQRCSEEARYRIVVRGPIASIDGFICTNHMSRLAPSLGIDPMRVGRWVE